MHVTRTLYDCNAKLMKMINTIKYLFLLKPDIKYQNVKMLMISGCH